METITIRRYEQADWTRLCAIHDTARMQELALAGLTDAFIPLVEAAENEDLFEYAIDVACIGGEVVGFVACSEDELAWLYVDPAWMRWGIGRALVAHAIGTVPQRPLHIEVLSGNEPAIALYRRMGFETVKMVTGEMVGNETYTVTVHQMEKA